MQHLLTAFHLIHFSLTLCSTEMVNNEWWNKQKHTH